MALCCPSILISQAEELGDIPDVMCGELFQHLLIPHTLAKCNHNRSIRDMRDGIMNLREPLDEATQSLPRVLLYGMEVGLIARSRVSTLEVGRELAAQLSPGGESPIWQVHEPRPRYTRQGHREVVGHDGLVSSYCKD
jgi:hypothetical protein